jgi:hypothetical protein
MWADGLNPRSDGLTWACSDFNPSDGTHPAASGREKVADSLLAFVRHDVTTSPWYTIPGTLGVPSPNSRSPRLSLSVSPNPSRGSATLTVTAPAGAAWRLTVVDAAGRRVREANGLGTGLPENIAMRIVTQGPVRPGTYFARLDSDGGLAVRRLVLLATPTGQR